LQALDVHAHPDRDSQDDGCCQLRHCSSNVADDDEGGCTCFCVPIK
jgi:hypothetical protein